MAPIRYSLHYEDYSEHLISRFGKLLQMQSLVDMTLMCNSHTLRVHKVVLAASSAYFQEVLQKQSGEPLIILKMRFNVLKCLVEFMYCGKTQCLEENLDELVAAAQFLKIKGLSKVTKEGLGVTSHGELPAFTPPVVIDRAPQSLVDLHSQECTEARQGAPLAGPGVALDENNRPNKECTEARQGAPLAGPGVALDENNRPNKVEDMVMRIPFDITCGVGGGTATAAGGVGGPEFGLDYPTAKPRRGRPTIKHGMWESGGAARSAGRAPLQRDHDSRKALHRIPHLQPRHLQDYMDSMSLSQAVNSICGTDMSAGAPYTGVGSDFMYMEQPPVVPPITTATACETTQAASASFADAAAVPGVNTVMSQYVNALKSAGLPTDLPILFEAGDGTYINVNEQVLLDMVQSGEIQYEVIEQPNIIEKVADPNEIKSIDDLSRSIERGGKLFDSKNYTPISNLDKDRSQAYCKDMEGMDSLDAILSDNLESFDAQQNYVVLEPRLQDANTLHNVNAPDFSCMDGDMQFFTKTINDDVKKYYEDQHLNETKSMEELCTTNTALDTNYTMSLLDTKTTHLMTDNMENQYNTHNTEDLRESEEYEFGLQYPQNNDFKGDPLDSLVNSAKESLDKNEQNLSPKSQEQPSNANNCNSNLGDGVLSDLIDFEYKIDAITQNKFSFENKTTEDCEEFPTPDLMVNDDFKQESVSTNKDFSCSQNIPSLKDTAEKLSINSSKDNWKDVLANDKDLNYGNEGIDKNEDNLTSAPLADNSCNLVDLTTSKQDIKTECLDELYNEVVSNNKENVGPNLENIDSGLNNDIPLAVGLLPLKQVQSTEETDGYLKRKIDENYLTETDTKCLQRKLKCKKS